MFAKPSSLKHYIQVYLFSATVRCLCGSSSSGLMAMATTVAQAACDGQPGAG